MSSEKYMHMQGHKHGKTFAYSYEMGYRKCINNTVRWLRENAPCPYNIIDADMIIGFLADAIEKQDFTICACGDILTEMRPVCPDCQGSA